MLKTKHLLLRMFAAMAAVSFLATGCEDDGGNTAGTDYGDNDPNIVACVGDSLTQGQMSVGAPYPERLAALTGKTVLNYGVGGSRVGYGVSIISSVVARKPAYVCILYGTNDVGDRHSPEYIKESLRQIITVCKNNQSIPIIATLPPQTRYDGGNNPRLAEASEAIRALAKEEGIVLVDLFRAFGNGEWLINPEDGLHFSDAGGDLTARMFASKIP